MSRHAAASGMVLLENDGVLPLTHGQKIALFGIGSRQTIPGPLRLTQYETVTVEAGLRNAGFQINTDAWAEERDPEMNTAVVVFSRVTEPEKERRQAKGDYYLSDAELTLLHQVKDDYEKVIVVLNMSCVIDLSFLEDSPVNALLLMGLAGPEGGNALADILTGDVTPCGHLTDTWAYHYEDYPTASSFCRHSGTIYQEKYTEGIYMGYRYFDTFGVKPRYPFGYGLSYTTFEHTVRNVNYHDGMISIEMSVKNTGAYRGADVVEFYVSKPWGLRRKELKQLVGFQKTRVLNVGEEVSFTMEAPVYHLASWHTGKSRYFYDKGDYIVLAGSSSERVAPVGLLHFPKTLWMDPLKGICPLQDALSELIPPEDVYQKKRAEWMQNTSELPKAEIKSAKLIRHIEDSWELIDWEDIAGDEIAAAPFALRRMSLNEKIHTVVGQDSLKNVYDFQLAHELLPCGTLLAQSFDMHLLRQIGELIGEMMREAGVRLYLSPSLNLHRDPLGGENANSYSEDPLLNGLSEAALTDGIQMYRELGVVMRSFACSNRAENQRGVAAVISERALREIYFKGFEFCIRQSQPKALMTSYNKINGVHSANSYDLCTEVARNEWGFEGVILTSQGATNDGAGCSAAKCIAAGVDLVMPGNVSDIIEVKEALEGNGDFILTEDQLDICALRVLTFLVTR